MTAKAKPEPAIDGTTAEDAEEFKPPVAIPLRRRDGSVRAVAVVDAADAGMVDGHRWHIHKGGAYAATKVRALDGREQTVLLHRLLMGLEVGDPREVDHINRDTLDCRRENLRIATGAQNAQNQRPSGYRGSSSRFRGVSWDKQNRKWRAYARLAGRLRFLGLFDSEEEAGVAAAAFRAEHMSYAEEAEAA